MSRFDQNRSARLCAEGTSGSARSELIKLIQHRLREPTLGPTLLVLHLLRQQESLSPQGIELIQMLQRSIKEEIRAIKDCERKLITFLKNHTNGTEGGLLTDPTVQTVRISNVPADILQAIR